VSNRGTLVEQTRDRLLGELRDGTFRAGSRLPNEKELARRFRVSRLTIREAVGGLVESGFVTRRQGSGTYVTGALPRRHSLDTTVSYTAMIREAGMQPGQVVLNCSVRGATTEDSERLDVPRDEPLMCLERIRTADDRPVIYSRDRIPERLVADTAPRNRHAVLHAVLEQSGSAVHSATARLTPVVADPRLARLLQVRRGSPLLHIDQVDHDRSGHAVMAAAEWHVPDVVELHVNRRRT
jgi:GntR family transcriptional regulator